MNLTHSATESGRMMAVTTKKRSSEQKQRLITLGELSRTLAHEIRNPLTGISTLAQVLDGKITADDPCKKYIEQILKETERVNRIVKDILHYARPVNIYLTCTCMYELVEEVFNGLKERITAGSIIVENHVES